MARKYVPKKRHQWRDKDKRMTRAVELRATGWSLRKIAEELTVSYQTVARDLARWDRERSAASATVTSVCHKLPQPMGQNVTSECDGVSCDGVWSARVGGTLLECRVHQRTRPTRPDRPEAAGPIADVIPLRRTS